MSVDDDCMQRQEIELSSVKAIYPEIIDLREGKGIKIKQTNRKNQRQPTWRPLEIQITIKPNTENVYVQVDLVVKCSNKYPKESPSFELKNVVGLSNQIVQELENELIELSKELAAKDEEGLFMFINKVEENLLTHNKPAPKSFYDQMLSNQLEQQKKEEQLKMEMVLKEKQKEEELNKEIKEAIIEKQKLLENEIRKRRSSFMDNDEIIASINSLENSISNLKESYLTTSKLLKDYHLNNRTSLRSCEIDHLLIECKFKAIIGNEELNVQRYSCELHCDQYRTDYLAIEQNKKNSSPFYFLSEWNLKLNNHKIDKNQLKEDKTKIMKELLIIRTKLEHQLQNLNHQNIIQPLSFIYSLDNDLICLRLLQNHVDNIRFCDLPFVFCKFQQEIKSTPFYFIQILDALNYLHSNKLVHGNLTTENILIDLSTGHIKLINILVDVYVNDFIEKTKSIDDKKLLNPFLDNSKINFKLKDIELDYLNFGYLLIWFLLEFKINFKELLLIKQADLIKMLYEQNVVECTIELIKNCLDRNSLTIIEPLIVEYFESSLKKLNDNINENQKRKPFDLTDDLDNEQFTNNDDCFKNLPLTCKNSRLSDFVILSKLGHGGFGEVYKVKNILDQNEYALKKIKINTTNKLLNKKIKQEVRYLSGLCHENVVRYFRPGNIFLDSYDHVKIGDFGLATAYVNELIRADNQTANNQEILAITNNSSNLNDKFSNPNQSMTLNNPKSEIVGTPFYLSPEITSKSKDLSAKKITYTQKVDIYSSGIIMFEMFYPSPSTGMERFKILTNLRLPEIVFPDDVNFYLTEQEKCLIKLLLNHNPKERPTSSELLESEYLPPLEIEEAKQQVMIKQIIQDPRSKQHKFLLNSLFNKPMSSVDDIVYDSEIDIIKSKKLINNEQLRSRVFQFVSDKLVSLLKKYGAYRYTAPTFTPTSSLNRFNLNNTFCVMDNNGCTIVPPYDLRIPFARFIARNPNLLSSNNMTTFKRYAIEKVYRSRIIGYHPRELYELAFDIVTQQTGIQWPIIPDVEVLLALNEIIDTFDNLKNKPFTLRINSVKFLKAVFSYFEIDDQHFDQVLRILAESNDRNYVSKSNDSEYSKTPKDHINHMLTSKNILESNKTQILIQMLFENEKNNSKEVIELIESFMVRRTQPKQKLAYEKAIDAIKELGLIIDCLQNSCNTFRMKIKFVPNLVLNLSNCNIYSRLIFQLQYDIVKKHQIIHQILATGGRYDGLIQNFSVNFTSKTDPANARALINAEQRTAVGFSLEIEKIIRCVVEDEERTNQEEKELADCDLVLYTEIYDNERYRLTFKDLCQITNELRQQGFRVKVFNEQLIKLADLNKYCTDNLIKYLFILIQANDPQQTTKNLYQLKQLTFEREKSFDRKSLNVMNCAELIDYIKYELNYTNQNYSSSPFNTNQFNTNQFSNSNAFTFESTSCSISSNYLSSNTNFSANLNTTNVKYQSKIDLTAKISSTTNIQFIDIEKTFESISKKKVHQLIVSSISNKLNYLMNTSIEVLALELPFKILKLIVYESDFEKDGFGKISDSSCEENIKRCVEKCPKYKNQINELMYRILELKRKSAVPLIILVSLNDLHSFNFVIVP